MLRPLPETPVLFPFSGETARLAVLVDRVTDPVDPGVAADGFVVWAVGERRRRIDRTKDEVNEGEDELVKEE